MTEVIASLFRHRALVGALVARDLKARYRGTMLGYLWSLLNPLLLLVVYTVVFTAVIPARADAGSPYPLFLLAGLLPWLFLSGALLDAAVVLPDNGPLLKKVVCPPEVFPAVTVTAHFVHHLLALPVLLVATGIWSVVGGTPVPWTVVLLPLALLPLVVTAAGLALVVAALAAHFRDLKDLLHNLLHLTFFLTPIIYPVTMVPEGVLRRLVVVNPITPLVTVYRDLVLLGRLPSAATVLGAVTVAVVSAVFGAAVFGRLRDTLAEAV
ncbi:MAG: ABC transporter permease [Acidobacteriota bacterium]